MLTVCCNLCSAQASSTIPPLECSSGSGINSLSLANLCGSTGWVKSSPGGSKTSPSVKFLPLPFPLMSWWWSSKSNWLLPSSHHLSSPDKTLSYLYGIFKQYHYMGLVKHISRFNYFNILVEINN